MTTKTDAPPRLRRPRRKKMAVPLSDSAFTPRRAPVRRRRRRKRRRTSLDVLLDDHAVYRHMYWWRLNPGQTECPRCRVVCYAYSSCINAGGARVQYRKCPNCDLRLKLVLRAQQPAKDL